MLLDLSRTVAPEDHPARIDDDHHVAGVLCSGQQYSAENGQYPRQFARAPAGFDLCRSGAGRQLPAVVRIHSGGQRPLPRIVDDRPGGGR